VVRSGRQSTKPQESSRCLASLAAESPCVPQAPPPNLNGRLAFAVARLDLCLEAARPVVVQETLKFKHGMLHKSPVW